MRKGGKNFCFYRLFLNFLRIFQRRIDSIVENVVKSRKNQKQIVKGDNMIQTSPIYPQIKQDFTYTVRVLSGEQEFSLPVYNDIRHANHYNSNSMNAERDKRFCMFSFSGEVTVEITVHTDFSSFVIAPSDDKPESRAEGNVICVKIDKPRQIVLRLDDDDDSMLSVFADALETDIPDPNGEKTVLIDADSCEPINGGDYPSGTLFYVTPGFHDVPHLLLMSNQQLYIAPGAVLNSRVRVDECQENVKIFGRGILRDYNDTRAFNSNTDERFYYLLTLGNSWDEGKICRNVEVKDIILLDPTSFSIVFLGAQDCLVDNVKVITGEISTDGFSFWGNTKRITITNSYLHVTDNLFVCGAGGMCDDIYCENCMLGTSIKLFFPQGLMGKNNVFRNLHVFRAMIFYEAVGGYTGRLFAENVSAIDCTDTLFVNTGMTMSGIVPREFELKNVTLPDTSRSRRININANKSGKEVGGYTFGLHNVYYNDRKIETVRSDYELTSNLYLKDESTDGARIDIRYTDDYSPILLNRTKASYTAIKLFVGHRPLMAPIAPYEKDGAVRIDGAAVAEAYGFGVSQNDGLLAFSDENTSVTVHAGEATAAVNGKFVSLSASAEEIDGRMTVPFDFFASVLGLRAHYESYTKSLRLENFYRADNLLADGDFEDVHSLRHWTTRNFTYVVRAKEGHTGNYCMQYKGTTNFSAGKGQMGAYAYVLDAVRQYGAGVYRVTFFAKSDSENLTDATVGAGLSWHYNANVLSEKMQPLTAEWKKYTFDIELEENLLLRAKKMAMSVVCENCDSVLIDDVTMIKLP